MDLSARTVSQSNDRANRRLAHQSRRLPIPLRAVWVAVVTLLLAVALWLGMTTRGGGAPLVRPTAAPTVLATSAPSGGSAAQATPTDQQRASWYLQQQDSEQDYCQCGR